MSARKNTNRINLLPGTELDTSTWGRVLAWALSSFRAIVILTEMVVMLAFMSRFWLDARSNDLNDSIKQKTGVISAFSDFEKEFKNTQKRLAIFNQVAAGNDAPSSTLSKVTSYLPDEITLTSYAITGSQVEIMGSAASEMAIAQLSANLKSDKTFSNITVAGITTNAENPAFLDFDLKLELAGKAAK
jgi:Tfp pilus assembly protein PilN